MDNKELFLIKELIKESVGSIVRETIREELSKIINKDLKEVKLLLAKSIKENRSFRNNDNIIVENRESSKSKGKPKLDPEIIRRIKEHDESAFYNESYNVKPPVPRFSQETAANLSINGSLPDFDAPIPMINKGSVIWNELNEKIG